MICWQTNLIGLASCDEVHFEQGAEASVFPRARVDVCGKSGFSATYDVTLEGRVNGNAEAGAAFASR